ncbi:MAG: Alpha-galactosidase [Parcubacteria group bacterium Gr01-1014_18]|nr:MAG: Alpha-galactosidase [Parcubacteria group bacterium Greene0416_36]TSC81163.1 MAG: Alpha-galactosidase [Parcubacteria group bacterium Gr01-1014_18]TSC99160.1 MAG: Alpha-galactosidase [Parcubacteria group bacterium Greene1014_20]TSD07482.1 MAG: Alpha-galactosidase [Parcubacteria group bacterium Greene0714_2]
MKTIWINFLHAYQPPSQDAEVLAKVADECYRPLIALAKKYPSWNFTFNISGVLTELLFQNGFGDIIDGLRFLAERGQIEWVSSAMYHPILPLIPAKQALRQIDLNDEINRRILGASYSPKGFFCPEMAVDDTVLDLIARKGYKWAILDEYSAASPVSPALFYKHKSGLSLVFRNRQVSKTYVPFTILGDLKKNNIAPYIISATDAELYGHHHRDHEDLLEKVLSSDRVSTWTIGRYLCAPFQTREIKIQPSSWETTPEDFKEKNSFPLWKDPKNIFHQKLWSFAQVMCKILDKYPQDPNLDSAQFHLDRGLASCAFWWCSAKRPSPFCPITWNPDEIEKGLLELVKVSRSLGTLPSSVKIRHEKSYHTLKMLLWQRHWEEFGKK